MSEISANYFPAEIDNQTKVSPEKRCSFFHDPSRTEWLETVLPGDEKLWQKTPNLQTGSTS